MRRFVFFIFAIVFVVKLSCIFADWRDIDGYRIRKIVFEKLSRQCESLIREVITIREGEEIDFNKLVESTKSIYRLSILYDFRVEYNIVDESKKLVDIYIVGKEADIVDEVKIVGSKSVQPDDLKELITIRKGDHISQGKIYGSILAMKHKYKEEGLLDVEIKHYFSRDENGKLTLTFEVLEGPRSIVKSIKLLGVSNISEGDIKAVIDTKEEVRFLGLPITRGYFDPDKFSKDVEKIKYFYSSRGFIDAKVISTNITVSNFYENQTNLTEKHVYILLEVSEGSRYYFGKISIVGETRAFTKDDIMQKFPFLKGDVFAQDQFDKWMYKVSRMYWDRGYVFAKVDKKIEKDEETKVVNIEVNIYEGDIGHIGNIVVVGNTYTRTYVIERELEIREGEIFTVNKLQRSIERLNMTQYFEKVEWEVREGEAEGVMDLIFRVKEGRTGIVSLSAGYGSVSGFTVSGSISHINLFGTGKKIQGKIEVGQNQQGVNLSFTEPYLFGSLFSFSTSIYFYNTLVQNILVDDDRDGTSERTNGSYWQTKLGLGLNVSRRIGSYYSLGAGYSVYSTITHDKTFDNAYDESVVKELTLTYVSNWWEIYRGKLKSSLSLNFTFDSRDAPLASTKGVSGGVYFDYVGHLIGGFFEFLKLSANFSFYQSIPITDEYKLVWVLYTSHGIILPQLSGRLEYETLDLFWFDGYYELRGWGGRGIRGRVKSFYSSELRAPIYGNELWGVMFTDLGSMFSDPQLYTTFLDRYYGSFGLGAMINIPGFPIRIYLARQIVFENSIPKLYLSDKFFENWQFVFAIQGLF
ncbi:MAG: outer membrane protein assembly factor BamA [Brevinematia bacterium]